MREEYRPKFVQGSKKYSVLERHPSCNCCRNLGLNPTPLKLMKNLWRLYPLCYKSGQRHLKDGRQGGVKVSKNMKEAWTEKFTEASSFQTQGDLESLQLRMLIWTVTKREELSQYFDHNLASESGVPALPFSNLFRFTESNFLDPISLTSYIHVCVMVKSLCSSLCNISVLVGTSDALYHRVHQTLAGVGLAKLLFTLSDVEMSFEKVFPVEERSMGCKMGADVLDGI